MGTYKILWNNLRANLTVGAVSDEYMREGDCVVKVLNEMSKLEYDALLDKKDEKERKNESL